MRIRRLSRISFGVARHGLVVSAALAYWAIAVGVPLPVAPTKDVSVPFPCMHRSCGCQSAAGCKEHCCCFTDEQKLAWAAEHEVDSAPFVSDRAWRDIEAGHLLEPFDGRPRLAAACCVHDDSTIAPATATTCAATTGAADTRAAAEPSGCQTLAPRAAPTPTDSISISAYRQCHGFSPLWTLASASLPPPDATRYEYPWELSANIVTLSSIASLLSFTPPTPPPRG